MKQRACRIEENVLACNEVKRILRRSGKKTAPYAATNVDEDRAR
jgi:hypothetical protein